MKINLNDHIIVNLTDFGREIFDKYFLNYPFPQKAIDAIIASYILDNGTFRFTLGEAMNIFGNECFVGNVTVFEDNEFEME